MFTRVDDTIYYNGYEFAKITATATGSGGWVMDARDAIDDFESIPYSDFEDYVTELRKEVKEAVKACLEYAVDDLWLPDAYVEPMVDRLTKTVDGVITHEIAETLGYRIE